MLILKFIFVILLMIPLFILAFMLLNRLFDNALKYKDKAVRNSSGKRRRRR